MMKAYTDVDWARSIDHRKSTSGGASFLGDKLVSWLSKKKDSVHLSTTKEKYIATSSCCTQVMQIK